MKYKALILDLDGTTIPNATNSAPNAVVSCAITKAQKLVAVSVATGRPLAKTRYLLEYLHIQAPCVLDQGAQIYDPVGDAMLREYRLDQTVVPAILSVFSEMGVPFYVFDGEQDALYTKDLNVTNPVGIFVDGVENRLVDAAEKKLKNVPDISVHKMTPWNNFGTSLEVTHAQATKMHGVYEVAKILGISPKEMIGVGDGHNDFPLLMACGLKVAMGNAVQELKDIADYIAPTVDEDGVADVIEKFILTDS
jgi:5-amino-6-(5-phospho-D-ribitylamino)uracil phosphatase